MDEDQSKEARKTFLRRLPIWANAFSRVQAQADQLEFDLQLDHEKAQAAWNAYVRLPALKDPSEPKENTRKRYNDEDIIKYYRKEESGDITVEDAPKNASKDKKESSSSEEMLRAKPQQNDLVFAMIDPNEPWVKCKIKSVFHKAVEKRPVTLFALTTLDTSRTIRVGKYCVARVQDHGENLRVPKRVIAGLSEDRMTSGIIGQEPCESNKHRYMVLLDDATCQYFEPSQVYPIFYQSEVPWRDLRHLGIQNDYLDAELNYFFKYYPRRTLMLAKRGQQIEISRNGEMVPAMIIEIDCDTMRIVYKDRTEQRIFRGCPRLNKRNDVVGRLLKEDISFDKLFDKLAGNIKRYRDAGDSALNNDYLRYLENFNRSMKICGSNTARKSTGRRVAQPKFVVCLDNGEVPDDTETKPFISDLPEPTHKKCTPDCLYQADMLTEASVEDIVEKYRDTSDLKVPLMLGWKRTLVKSSSNRGKITTQFVYETPCGRIFRWMSDIKRYILQTGSKLDVDYFTFDRDIILNRAVGERRAYYHEPNLAKSSAGAPLENKFISVINPVCEERLPLDFEYHNNTFPHPMLKDKKFSFNTEFKSGCNCGDCSVQPRSIRNEDYCPCLRLIEEAAGTSAVNPKCHYKYKRLPEQVSTGIFECNEFCSCGPKCPNRVVQNGIRIRMQVRKTIDKGWGVFTLDDVPKGTFICTYSAELLDDADQYGNSDMYYADLDYITVVEQQKIGLDSDEGVGDSDSDSENSRIGNGSRKRHYQRDVSDISSGEGSSEPPYDKYMPRMDVDRVQDGERRNTRYKSIHAILKTNQDYTLDARLGGNVGRFFNHSCDASMYPQNIFISTHDLRLPVIAFFTKRALKADDELTWHYQYQIGSIPGRQIICRCGAPNCQGRLL